MSYVSNIKDKIDISFCITCKNRLHQLKKTLKKNLLDNSKNTVKTEFILVDFSSTDGLQNWVIENFSLELELGYLKYFFTDRLYNWHCSVAKNTAHFLAGGDILVNLDSDNYTGLGGGEIVANIFGMFESESIVLHQFSGKHGDGSFGRISLHKKDFLAYGGYNEAFEPMAYQDVDLILRLKASGFSYKHFNDKKYCKAIKNTKAESIVNTSSTNSYAQMNFINEQISNKNIKKRMFVANNGVCGIREDIFAYENGTLLKLM